MNARAAKLIRHLRAKLDPQAQNPGLEAGLKRMWRAAPRRKKRGLRAHMRRAAAAAPEDVSRIFEKGVLS